LKISLIRNPFQLIYTLKSNEYKIFRSNKSNLLFPQDEFTLNKDNLKFHNVDLMKLVEEYGTPLKFTYLPQISNNINKAKNWFRKSMEKINMRQNIITAIVQRAPILNS
jgi:hypothetical protein